MYPIIMDLVLCRVFVSTMFTTFALYIWSSYRRSTDILCMAQT